MTQPTAPVQRTAEEIVVECKLSGEAGALVRKGESWHDFFNRLIAGEHWDDAFRFVAHALPKRLAIWWGALCLWNATRPNPPPEVDAILKAVVTWLKEPTEEHRRDVEKAGSVLKFGQPAGSLALAVFTSGGSIAPADQPVVEPTPDLSAKSVALTVSLLLKQGTDRAATRRGFCALVQDVAAGKCPPGLLLELPAPPKPEKAEAKKNPIVADESIGRMMAAEQPVTPRVKDRDNAADRPAPRKLDDRWADLPRTSSSGKARPTTKPHSADDESIGKCDDL